MLKVDDVDEKFICVICRVNYKNDVNHNFYPTRKMCRNCDRWVTRNVNNYRSFVCPKEKKCEHIYPKNSKDNDWCRACRFAAYIFHNNFSDSKYFTSVIIDDFKAWVNQNGFINPFDSPFIGYEDETEEEKYQVVEIIKKSKNLIHSIISNDLKFLHKKPIDITRLQFSVVLSFLYFMSLRIGRRKNSDIPSGSKCGILFLRKCDVSTDFRDNNFLIRVCFADKTGSEIGKPYDYTHEVSFEVYKAVNFLKKEYKLENDFLFPDVTNYGTIGRYINSNVDNSLHFRAFRTHGVSKFFENELLNIKAGSNMNFELTKAYAITSLYSNHNQSTMLRFYIDIRITILFYDRFGLNFNDHYELYYWDQIKLDINWAIDWFEKVKTTLGFKNTIDEPFLLYNGNLVKFKVFIINFFIFIY